MENNDNNDDSQDLGTLCQPFVKVTEWIHATMELDDNDDLCTPSFHDEVTWCAAMKDKMRESIITDEFNPIDEFVIDLLLPAIYQLDRRLLTDWSLE